MGYRIRTLILVSMACLWACQNPKPLPVAPDAPTNEPPTPLPPADAAPTDAPPGVDQQLYAGLDNAAQACEVLKFLKCPEADVADCAADVRKLVQLGTFEQRNVLCIRQSRTVEKVRLCDVKCKRP